LLTIRHLHILNTHTGQPLPGPLAIEIAAGEILTLMGPSGLGKSTLLNWMVGALPEGFRAQGELWLNGVRLDGLPTEQRRIGLLFQDDLLFPHLSVGGNLAFALPGSRHADRQQRRARIEHVLAEAGLADFYARDPHTLSGGQRARISVLRTLLAEPRAVLLDEPFSRLDTELRARFREFVRAAIAERGIPALLVTHDHADVPPGGRILNLEDYLHA